MKYRRILAVLMILVLSCSMMTGVLAGEEPDQDWILPEREHAHVTYDSLRDLSFDLEAFDTEAQAVTALCTDASNADQVSEKLAEIREMYLTLDTLLAMSQADSYLDVTDQSANDIYAQYLDWYYEEDELMADLIPAVLDSPCADCVDQADEVFSLYIDAGDYDGYTDEELALYSEELDLEDQYDLLAADSYTAEINGTEMDANEAYEAWYSGEITDDEYDAAALTIAQEENAAMAGIYVDLVSNRKQQAALYGYEDPAAYYDDNTYFRDYTAKQREEFYEAVKTQIVPLVSQIDDQIGIAYYTMDGEDTGYSPEELLSMLRTGIQDISDEFLVVYDYMATWNYCDIGYSDTRADTGYTTMLPEPNAPYLFLTTTGTDYDFSSLVHEFGHYTAYFCSSSPYTANIDLAEVHSQGLELLMLKNYEEIFGEKAEYEELYTIYQLLTSLVDGCLYDELERYAYSEPDLTVDKLNTRYMTLLKEYGYQDADAAEEMAYGWVEIPHLFSSPLYYLSYAVSAAGAFDLWEQSLTDYDGAVDTYLNLVALGEEGWFLDTMAEVGIDDPISEGEIHAISVAIGEQYGVTAGEWTEADTLENWVTEHGAAAVQGWFLVLNALGAVIAGAAILIGKRRRKEER